MDRVTHLQALKDGWTGRGSIAPDPFLLSWISDHATLISSAPHAISVIPVADGNVALQWASDSREFTAELTRDRHLYLFVDEVDSDGFEEGTVELTAQALQLFITRESV